MSYQNQNESLAEKLRQLDEENTRLRNTVLTCNDEIYSLKAVAAAVEAELKYNTEQELANMESELKFKSNDLAKLSRDYEKVLKELASIKQAQAIASRRAPRQEPTQEVVDCADNGFDEGSQSNGFPSQNTTHTSVTPIHTNHANKEKYSAPQTKAVSVNKAVVDLENVRAVHEGQKLTVLTGAPAVEKISDAASVASSSRASNARIFEKNIVSSVDSTEPLSGSVKRMHVLSAQFQQTVLHLVSPLSGFVNNAAIVSSSCSQGGATTAEQLLQTIAAAISKCANEACVEEDDCDLAPLNEAVISLCSLLLETTTAQTSTSAGLLDALESCLVLLDLSMQHSVAQMGRLVRCGAEAAGQDAPGIGTVVAGNLQKKFELAADSSGAKTIPPSTAAPGCSGVGDKRPASKILSALKTPYLNEAQRQAAWAAPEPDQAPSLIKANAVRRWTETVGKIEHSVGRYAALLEEILCVVGPPSDENLPHASCLIQCFRAWGRLYSALNAQSNCATAVKDALSVVPVRRGLFDRVLHLLCANRVPGSLGGNMVTALQSFLTFSRRGFDSFCEHQQRRQPGHQSRAARHASDKKEKEKEKEKGGETSNGGTAGHVDALLHVLVAQLVSSSGQFSLAYRLQVIIFMENLLSRFGPCFALLVLGLDACPTTLQPATIHGAAAESSAGKKRSRAESRDSKAPSRNVSAKQQSLSASGGALQNTPSIARKAGVGGDTAGAAVAVGARITPNTHPSASRSGRKFTPPTPGGVAVLDLQPLLGQVQRGVLSDLVRYWMRLIRSLDNSSSLYGPSAEEKLIVALIMRLNMLLAGILCHLSSQDCDFVLSDVTDTFHEYIYRSNTSGWSPLLKMPESLFVFLESHRNTDSLG